MALEDTGFKIETRRVAALRPHEETIPSHVRGLAEEIRRDGIQKDPMIVDAKTGTVLDGMHRLAAFESLGIEWAVCCAVDYQSDSVEIGSWARVYVGATRRGLESLLKASGLALKASNAEAMDGLELGTAQVAALTTGGAYVSPRQDRIQGAFSVIRALDTQAESNNWKRLFVPQDEAASHLGEDSDLVVLVRKLGKGDVLSAARSGTLFPCKTSMHLVEPRPVAVDFPLKELSAGRTPDIKGYLRRFRWNLLPAGSTYEGRKYKERLLVMNRN